MAREERAPEQVIRHWLDVRGSTTVGLDAITETWSLEHLSAADRRRIATALEDAGVVVEPPLARAGARDKLQLSVAAPAPPPAGDSAPPTVAKAPLPDEAEAETPPPATTPEPEEPEAETPEPAKGSRPAEPAKAPTSDERLEPPKAPLAARLAPLAIAVMVIGALGPWSKAVFVTDYGTDRAGWVVLAVAAVAAVLLIVHASRGRRSPVPLIVAVLGTVAVAIVASELRDLSEDEFLGPAWGAYASFAGSAGLVLSSVALLARRT